MIVIDNCKSLESSLLDNANAEQAQRLTHFIKRKKPLYIPVPEEATLPEAQWRL